MNKYKQVVIKKANKHDFNTAIYGKDDINFDNALKHVEKLVAEKATFYVTIFDWEDKAVHMLYAERGELQWS